MVAVVMAVVPRDTDDAGQALEPVRRLRAGCAHVDEGPPEPVAQLIGSAGGHQGPVVEDGEVVGERLGDGTVSFTWLSPQDGWRGTYLYRSDVAGQEDEDLEPTTKPSATIAAQPGSTCIEVYAVQTDGRMSQPVRSCVTTP